MISKERLLQEIRQGRELVEKCQALIESKEVNEFVLAKFENTYIDEYGDIPEEEKKEVA